MIHWLWFSQRNKFYYFAFLWQVTLWRDNIAHLCTVSFTSDQAVCNLWRRWACLFWFSHFVSRFHFVVPANSSPWYDNLTGACRNSPRVEQSFNPILSYAKQGSTASAFVQSRETDIAVGFPGISRFRCGACLYVTHSTILESFIDLCTINQVRSVIDSRLGVVTSERFKGKRESNSVSSRPFIYLITDRLNFFTILIVLWEHVLSRILLLIVPLFSIFFYSKKYFNRVRTMKVPSANFESTWETVLGDAALSHSALSHSALSPCWLFIHRFLLFYEM